jgi:superfamily II DNA or RNA helicase
MIQCVKAPSEKEYKALKKHFSLRQKGYFLKPAFRKGFWDGYDHFFNDVYLPIGLWGELQDYVVSNGYDFNINGLDKFLNFTLDRDMVFDFIATLFENTGINPRWYQYESIYRILKYRYSAQQLSTSSGKTMISFAVYAYLKHTGAVDKNNKFLMIVPRSGLVKQTYEKFIGGYDNGTVKVEAMMVGGGVKFDIDMFNNCDCVISTYQSLNNLPLSLFSKVKTINVDEAHTAKTESICSIIKASTPLRYRFGCSGTLVEARGYSEYYKNLEQLGPLTMVYDAKDLIDDGYAPNVKIIQLHLDYSRRMQEGNISGYMEYRRKKPSPNTDEELIYFKSLYTIERDMILNDEIRFNAIMNYVMGLDKNTLILFNDVKNEHGVRICQYLGDRGVTCDYIDGGTKNSDRELYISKIEGSSKMMLVASYGTFSTGIDLKNVHYIVEMESFKSPTLIGQSIGRGLREFKGKKEVVIIDVIDGLYKHTVNQSKDREKLYNKQDYSIERVDIVLDVKN